MGAQAIPSEGARAGREGVRKVLDAVRHLVRALRLSDHRAQGRVGVSAAQLFVLQSLRSGNGLSLGELAERTATDQSSASVVVARLVDRGLVHRRRSAEDARRLELSLTPRARALLRRAPARVAQHGLMRAVEGLPPGQRRALGRMLDRVVAAMGGGGGAPGMFFEPRPRVRQASRRRGLRNGP